MANFRRAAASGLAISETPSPLPMMQITTQRLLRIRSCPSPNTLSPSSRFLPFIFLFLLLHQLRRARSRARAFRFLVRYSYRVIWPEARKGSGTPLAVCELAAMQHIYLQHQFILTITPICGKFLSGSFSYVEASLQLELCLLIRINIVRSCDLTP